MKIMPWLTAESGSMAVAGITRVGRLQPRSVYGIAGLGTAPMAPWMSQSYLTGGSSPVTAVEIREAQILLIRLQMDPGPIDGLWGPKTISAVNLFVKTYGGASKTDGTLLNAIRRVGAAASFLTIVTPGAACPAGTYRQNGSCIPNTSSALVPGTSNKPPLSLMTQTTEADPPAAPNSGYLGKVKLAYENNKVLFISGGALVAAGLLMAVLSKKKSKSRGDGYGRGLYQGGARQNPRIPAHYNDKLVDGGLTQEELNGLGHPGRTRAKGKKKGCHYNLLTGRMHCHRGSRGSRSLNGAPFESDVSSKYGAPMGRRSDAPESMTGKTRLQKVKMVGGAYDKGGAYWGGGTPLYAAWDDDGHVSYVRAGSRVEAKKKFPHARFSR